MRLIQIAVLVITLLGGSRGLGPNPAAQAFTGPGPGPTCDPGSGPCGN